jgi:hypothetical protein
MPFKELRNELPDRDIVETYDTILRDVRYSKNLDNALQPLLYGILTSELSYYHFLSKVIDPSSEAGMILDKQTFVLKSLGLPVYSEPMSMYLADIPITINRSPPSEELLGKLVSTGTIGFGMYTGLSIVPEEANPFLLLSCVFGGIICISTAAGVGRALQDGIYQRLLSLFVSERRKKK